MSPVTSALARLRSVTRRPALGATAAALAVPEDHWHAGDPRLVPSSTPLPQRRLALVPPPRRGEAADPAALATAAAAAATRAALAAATALDTRPAAPLAAPVAAGGASVVDLRAVATTAPLPVVRLAAGHAWTESSTWLG